MLARRFRAKGGGVSVPRETVKVAVSSEVSEEELQRKFRTKSSCCLQKWQKHREIVTCRPHTMTGNVFGKAQRKKNRKKRCIFDKRFSRDYLEVLRSMSAQRLYSRGDGTDILSRSVNPDVAFIRINSACFQSCAVLTLRLRENLTRSFGIRVGGVQISGSLARRVNATVFREVGKQFWQICSCMYLWASLRGILT